jgi:hypothetical protein
MQKVHWRRLGLERFKQGDERAAMDGLGALAAEHAGDADAAFGRPRRRLRRRDGEARADLHLQGPARAPAEKRQTVDGPSRSKATQGRGAPMRRMRLTSAARNAR